MNTWEPNGQEMHTQTPASSHLGTETASSAPWSSILALNREPIKGKEPAPEHGPTNEEGHPKADGEAVPNTTEGWVALLDAMQKHDKNLINGWKDEMNNLLIFAGLFSAVVTAFTIESYQWLQEDPADASSQMLAQISKQLSSFTVTSEFINSTISPPEPSDFTVPKVAIHVNTLWFLSLTFSLLAAFFAIMVQQWLRHIPVPQHLSVREAIRLRQFRYTALVQWQVPTVVSLLPVLLQVAVILFFTGLIRLLFSIDQAQSVAVVFGAATGVALLIFILATLAPLVIPECPYKSPLLPAIRVLLYGLPIAALAFVGFLWMFVAMYLIGPVVAIAVVITGGMIALPAIGCIALISGVAGLRRLGNNAVTWFDEMAPRVEEKFETWWSGSRLGIYLAFNFFGRGIPSLIDYATNIDQFWVNRELKRLPRRSLSLDFEALCWAPSAVPRDHLVHVAQSCSGEFDEYYRAKCALRTTVASLGNYGSQDFEWEIFPFGSVYAKLEENSNHMLSTEYRELLLRALPKDWERTDWMQAGWVMPAVLVVLHQMTREDQGDFMQSFPKLLARIRDSQEIDEEVFTEWTTRIPTTLLYKRCVLGGYKLNREETSKALAWAHRQLDFFMSSGLRRKLARANIQELILGAVATSLHALAEHQSMLSEQEITTQIGEVFEAFDQFIVSETRSIRFIGHLRTRWSVLLITPQAVETICASLTVFAEQSLLATADDSPLTLLAGHLSQLCTGQTAFLQAMPCIQALHEALSVNNSGVIISVSGPQDDTSPPQGDAVLRVPTTEDSAAGSQDDGDQEGKKGKTIHHEVVVPEVRKL